MKEQVKDGAGTWNRCPPDAGSNACGEDSGPTRSMNARRSARSTLTRITHHELDFLGAQASSLHLRRI